MLPKKWAIIAKDEEEAKVLFLYANKKQGSGGWNLDNIRRYYLHMIGEEYGGATENRMQLGFEEITYQQFQQYILNKQEPSPEIY